MANQPSALIESLLKGAGYPHPVPLVELVETHISWLLLAGDFAYKIKKPVNFGFVDFSDLAKRKYYCHEELRLNRRFTPELYLNVLPITATPASPQLGGPGMPFEYAVQMARFPAEARLDRLLAGGRFTSGHCDQLAECIARAHGAVAIARPGDPFGAPAAIHRQTVDTLALAEQHARSEERRQVAMIRQWCDSMFTGLEPLLAARKAGGFIRECHGDLHLENMILLNGQARLFDCLEFSPLLRWIDVMSDLAFAAMDLADRGHPRLAHRLVNRYLEITGDYAGVALLPYYQVYRAVVRAAVAEIRRQQQPGDKTALDQQAHNYFSLTARFTRPTAALLVIAHGPSGAGKSTLTQPLLEQLGAIRLRSDLVRRQLPGTSSGQDGPEGRYTPAARRGVYEQMAALADKMLAGGYRVIVDATFLRRGDRDLFRTLAARRQVPLVVLDFDIEEQELRRRVADRMISGGDPSEATTAVLEEQLRNRDPLGEDERQSALVLEAAGAPPDELAACLEKVASRQPR